MTPSSTIQKLTPDQSRVEEYLALRDRLIKDQIVSYERFQNALNRVANLIRDLTAGRKLPTAVRAESAVKRNGNGSAARKTILSIAYDPAIAALEKEGTLAHAGYELKTVMTDWEAMAVLSHSHIDLVLVGLFASASERHKLVTTIKSQHPQVRVIVLFAGANEFYPEADVVLSPSDRSGELFYSIASLLTPPASITPSRAKYVAFVDIEGRYVEVSPGICRLLGYKREELIGRMVDDIFHEKPRTAWEDMYQQFLRQGFLHGRHVLRHKDGQAINTQYQMHFLPGGTVMAEWFPAATPASATRVRFI